MVNIYNINRNLVLLENKVNKAFVDRINKKPSLVNTIKLAALRQTWYIDSCRLIFQIHSQIVIIEIILKMIGRLSFWNKDNVSNEVDCLACRLVSGLGLLGIGAFLLAQSKKRQAKPLENFTMKGLAAGEPLGILNPVLFLLLSPSSP